MLSFLLPGLGHLYAGLPGGAVFRYLCLVAVGALSLALLTRFPLGAWSVPLAVSVALGAYVWVAVDARRAAAKASPDYRLRSYNRWYVYVVLVAGSLLFEHLVRSGSTPAGLHPYRIASGAMEPTLLIGDWLFVSDTRHTSSNLGRGAIVVYESADEPGLQVMKRVLGLPGDTLAMRDNVLYRNGVTVTEPYVKTTPGPDHSDPEMRTWQTAHLVGGDITSYQPTLRTWGPLLVPPDSVFVLGDNRDFSYDSRYFGFVALQRVRGRPSHIYYSHDPDGLLPLPFLTAVRWRRLGLRFDP